MKYVKRFSAAIALAILIISSVGVAPAAAHVLETDNGVSAILHIKPDDNPIAGKPVPVNFLFSNDVGGFSLNHYDVQLNLLQDSAVKFKAPIKPLFFGSATEGETLATFPTAGVYTLRAIGKPTSPDVPAFTLDFDVRVANAAGARTKGNGNTVVLLAGLSLVVLALLAAKTIKSGGKYGSRAKSPAAKKRK